MARYVVLINWTDEGRKNFRHTLKGYLEARAVMSKSGVSFVDVYWTISEYDLVGIVEGPDDESVTAAMLSISSLGGIRATATRAFSVDEIEGVLAKASTIVEGLRPEDPV